MTRTGSNSGQSALCERQMVQSLQLFTHGTSPMSGADGRIKRQYIV
ncbi:MAG TPA: hypothetical protein VGM82_08185 [Gemmatimonadaceae bacterium]